MNPDSGMEMSLPGNRQGRAGNTIKRDLFQHPFLSVRQNYGLQFQPIAWKMSGSDKMLEEEIVGTNGKSTKGLHQCLEPRLVMLQTPSTLCRKWENGMAKLAPGATGDAETLLVGCMQKYGSIWAASCSCLLQKAKQNEWEINSYQQQDENIYRKTKYRVGEKGLPLEGRACGGAGLHLGGVYWAVCLCTRPAYRRR